jgi:hypothetical protein
LVYGGKRWRPRWSALGHHPRQSDAHTLDTKSEGVTTLEKLNEEKLPACRYRYAGKIGDSDAKVKLLFALVPLF